MIGNIIEISEDIIKIELTIDISSQVNFIGVHVVFEDNDKKIIGEIIHLDKKYGTISIIGELKDNTFIPGTLDRPAFKSKCRIITLEELEKILGSQNESLLDKVFFGYSTIYKNFKINVDVNKFFANHFAILGNTGSGKSCTFARIMQNIFTKSNNVPVNSRFIIFDAYGEYVQAFSGFGEYNSNLATKVITTDINDNLNELFKIPIYLLDVDDVALLLNANQAEQLPIIEKALKLAPIFKSTDEQIVKLKNDIISRALLDILRSGKESTRIRDQITAVLSVFSTEELNLNTEIHQPGYVRTLKQCLHVDKTGKMAEMELVVDFFSSFVLDLKIPDPDGSIPYGLEDLKAALDFSLISEGILKSDKVYDYANILSVRLHSLINSQYARYFDYNKLQNKGEYISSLFLTADNRLAQVLDFNINYVDDRMGKVIAKIISRMVFESLVDSPVRGATPIHIVIEEAHRYVQEDSDLELLGYNIFDRITKEGRKYGAILGLITQRPSELTDTAVSQCSNFLIMRTLHPKDLKYINDMVPNITEEGVAQVKSLQPGVALAFGSAFPMSVKIKFELAAPVPLSNSSDIVNIWYTN